MTLARQRDGASAASQPACSARSVSTAGRSAARSSSITRAKRPHEQSEVGVLGGRGRDHRPAMQGNSSNAAADPLRLTRSVTRSRRHLFTRILRSL